MNNENNETEKKFRGMLRGEFSNDKRSDVLAIDIDDCRYLFDVDTDELEAETYALELHKQYN
jgi:hypothetical protein